MSRIEPRVLLIGENEQGSSHLLAYFERFGCNCRFATSHREAISSVGILDFELVLSPIKLGGSSVFSLITLLEGSHTSLFYFQAVEDSCWWLPALRSGQRCFGSPALRPSEFMALLAETIKEIRGADAAQEGKSPLIFPDVSAKSAELQVRLMPAIPAFVEKQRSAKRKAAG